MSLPKVTMMIREIDPTWVAVFADHSPRAINADSMYKDYELEVEIVQLNLNTNGMRIRYEWPCKHSKKGFKVVSRDVSLEHFFKKYHIATNSPTDAV